MAPFAGGHGMSPNLGISLVGPRPWLKCHFLFPLFFNSHIYLMNYSNMSHVNDNDISHQRFTVVIACSKISNLETGKNELFQGINNSQNSSNETLTFADHEYLNISKFVMTCF